MDKKDTISIIEKLNQSHIGNPRLWKKISRKISNNLELTDKESEYFAMQTRIYKGGTVTRRSKIYHTKLGKDDEKPACSECGQESLFYCNMNDAYFCPVHVIGHDENES